MKSGYNSTDPTCLLVECTVMFTYIEICKGTTQLKSTNVGNTSRCHTITSSKICILHNHIFASHNTYLSSLQII